MLEKTAIENASFARFLTSAFYQSQFDLTVAKRKQLLYNARLTVAGGTVSDQFETLFGSVSTGGLYDRFLFGKCPDSYQYFWRPLDDVIPHSPERAVSVHVERSVFEERDRWIREGISPRVAEISLRVATICASMDQREHLTADSLAPAHALAKYQMKVRAYLQPNVGENPDAIIAEKIRRWLEKAAPPGEYVSRRDLYREIHANRLGPAVFDRALRAMTFNGELEVAKQGKKEIVRLVVDELAAAAVTV